MAKVPDQVAEFLKHKRIAVAGVSRTPSQPANAILRKLRGAGYEVFAVNPNAAEVEGVACYPNISSISVGVEAVVIATPPDAAIDVVRECADLGITQVWMHRSFGQGSVSDVAVEECRKRGINCLVGGCPLMYCAPVDFAHRCFRWILKTQKRVPG